MKLLEFQGKALFEACGLRAPAGQLIQRGQDAGALSVPVLLKSQVLTGGRGKAGGIRMVTEKDRLAPEIEALFDLSIKGERAASLLAVSEDVDIQRELYLAITFQGADNRPVIIASGEGGMEIEDIAKADPNKLARVPIDPYVGVTAYQARRIAKVAGLDNVAEFTDVLRRLYDCFVRYDCTLVEINPLAVTAKGLYALDAKVVLDTKARFRHQALFDRLEKEQGDCAETLRADTITFVGLDGDVGLIADGAGTGMLTLDLVNERGGSVGSFCELGGVTNADVMYTAIEETMTYKKPKALLMVFIGGFNRMDHMAEGIRRYQQAHGIDIPVVIRMCGTKEAEGKDILKSAGLQTMDSLDDAVTRAISLAKGEETADGDMH